ncbi:hypothetical protein SAMN04487886_108313 [Clostridium sp. DSM 8431]|uniref:helix-turn-helix domain-containing protein n=1 Tax=Clostridium sp. DSM 8431 TaxID=1761781 RepID=UPI0008E52827|nr:helix-turn-helix transcriptional regulator [Clostridium sp. DSM 8431]SFU63741.1 hypothetical protein SAMN04487886_108313 [Clostridium sp. DSM 8431]
MQMINVFGDTLKELKSISGLKSVILANYLGYDVSYISKWCTDKKLPSGRNIVKIIEDASRIFAREIINGGKLEKFNARYETNIKEIKELSESIKNLLEDSYDRSKRNESVLKKDDNKIVFGRNEIVSCVKDRLKKLIENGAREFDIYTTLDILQMNIAYQDKEFLSYDFPRVNIRIGCDMSMQEKNNFERVSSIHYLLSRLKKCDFHVYDNKEFGKSNIFMVKNEFAILFSLNKDEEIDFGVFINDKEVLEKMYSNINNKFNLADNLIETISDEDISDKKYIMNFYNSDRFNFLFNVEFDYLRPELLIKNEVNSVLEKNRISYLKTIVDKNMKFSNINIFIVNRMLDNYIYSSLIESGHDEVKNIFKSLDYLIDSMKENEGIKLYTVDSEKFDAETMKYALPVYSGDNFTILKKYTAVSEDKSSFYVIKKP